MKKYKPIVLIILSILAVFGMLFGYVPQGFAQVGQDWTQPVNLSLSGIATNPLLAIDFENVLHAIWVDDVDGYKYSQNTEGDTWTKPQTVKYPFDKKGASPVMLSDTIGSFHIFWIDKDANLFYAKTNPSDLSIPSRWQSTRLAPDVVNYDVILDAQDVLHTAYIHNVNTAANPAGIYYRQSVVGRNTWTSDTKLYESEYFRSATRSESFIRIATSNTLIDQKVYVAWDNRPQKRVFMAVSNDSGLTWNEARQISDTEDTGGIEAPFNLNVAAVNDKVLMMWQVGEPEIAKCAVFSQWSEDNGKTWGDIVSVFGGSTDCPASSRVIVQEEEYIVAMMTVQGDPVLLAWNGKLWSAPQIQTQLTAISNPVTYDAILLGCRSDLINQNRLYVVGCDQGRGGDVWFLSRSLEPVENWFSPKKSWGSPDIMSGKMETISSLSSVSDIKGVIHTVWVQSSLSDDDSKKTAMEYARWDGNQWTNPEPIIPLLGGAPLQTSFSIDTQERLLLSWVDGTSGDLLFSWANIDRANLPSEWEAPVVLPSPSNLISSPDILVDGSGRIVIAYAIPLNEERGINVVQSTDSGKSWSPPVRVFDAVSARWEKTGSPSISLTADGVLHLIFSRKSVRPGQPVGLYYSRSLDGGGTWSDSQILSEGDIQWSDIASYDEHTVHIAWQEYDGLVFANLSQVSQDSGVSWGRTLDITGVNDNSTPVVLAADGSGKLHFIQVLNNSNATTINQDNLILQDWNWTGSKWELESSSDLVINGQGIKYSLSANVTTTGYLGVSVLAEYSDSGNTVQNEVLNFNRFLGETNISKETMIAVIPTPVILSNATTNQNILPTQPADLSVLGDDNISASSMLRNIVGVIIISVAMVVAVLLVIRRRNKVTEE